MSYQVSVCLTQYHNHIVLSLRLSITWKEIVENNQRSLHGQRLIVDDNVTDVMLMIVNNSFH